MMCKLILCYIKTILPVLFFYFITIKTILASLPTTSLQRCVDLLHMQYLHHLEPYTEDLNQFLFIKSIFISDMNHSPKIQFDI